MTTKEFGEILNNRMALYQRAKYKMMNTENLGKYLKSQREKHGISQASLSRQTFMSQGNISELEAGKRTVHLNHLINYAFVLKHHPAFLLYEFEAWKVENKLP